MSVSAHRVIVITGATRGLGRAMAERFREYGHTVIGCGRSTGIVQQLQKRFGPPHRFDVVDVSDDRQVARWAKEVLTQCDPPDLLLNNAAIINRKAPLWQVPADEFSDVIDVNIKGVVNVVRHFAPAMVQRRKGVIVNFSSGWGRSASSEVAPYCATKWAIEGLTQALAEELPHGMAAVALNPGVINTEMLQSCFGSSAHHYSDASRWSKTAVPFLLELNVSHNGQPLTVPD